jgi:1-carboxybiuret hydrolase subunit AtzG-like
MTRKPTRGRRGGSRRPASRSRKRPASASRAPAPVARKRAKPAKTTPARPNPLDNLIDAAVRALDLPIEASWRPAVATNLRVTLEHAASVEAFALEDDAEPAPVFRA